MSLPEHTKIIPPDLARLDAEIIALEDKARTLRHERQKLINAEAQKVAAFAVGHEFDKRNRRFRITQVCGEYRSYDGYIDGAPPVIFIAYKGVHLFKNGKVGREETVYPSHD